MRIQLPVFCLGCSALIVAGLGVAVANKLSNQLQNVESALFESQTEVQSLRTRVGRLQQREIDQRTLIQAKLESEISVPSKLGRLIFEGEIVEVSKLPPDLSTAPYPSAFRLIRVKPLKVFVGDMPKEPVVVASWVLWRRKQLPAAKFELGDRVYFDVEPTHRMPEWQARMARFDTLEYGLDETIWHDSLANQVRLARFASSADRVERNFAFQKELDRIRAGRDPVAIDFTYKHKFCSLLRPKGLEGWYVDHPNELFLKATDLFDPPTDSVPPAAAVLDLANFLESRGVEFIFASVPSKAEVYPEKFVADVPDDILEMVSPARYRFLEFLSQQGVEVIDLAKPLRERRDSEVESVYHFFTKGADPHLSFSGSQVIAEALEARLSEFVGGDRMEFWEKEVDYKLEGRDMKVRQVQNPDGSPFQPVKESPIALVGDSNLYWWQEEHVQSAGISAHISRLMGAPVDEISGGGLVPHDLRNQSTRLLNKRCVVYFQSSWVLWDVRIPWKLFTSDRADAEPDPADFALLH